MAYLSGGVACIHYAVSATVLGSVERGVGGMDEVCEAGDVGVGDAEAAGDFRGPAVVGEGSGLNGFAGAFGEGGCADEADAGGEDDEFFAAVAADDVFGAADFLESVRDAAEDFVAEEMAVGVVDVFEVVDIGEDAAEGPGRAGDGGEFGGEAVVEVGAGPETGEAVDHAFAGEEVHEVFGAECAADAGAEFGEVEWFGDVVDCAEFEATDAIFGGGDAAEEDDGDAKGGRVLLQVTADVEAVEGMHFDVEEDEVGINGDGGGEAFLAVEGGMELDGLLAQVLADLRVGFGGVVDDKNFLHGRLSIILVGAAFPTSASSAIGKCGLIGKIERSGRGRAVGSLLGGKLRMLGQPSEPRIPWAGYRTLHAGFRTS